MESALFAKVLGLGIIAFMVSGLTVYPAFASTPSENDLYFTTFSGGLNVHKVHYKWDGTTLTYGAITDIAATPGADGLNFLPTGKLFVGGQGPTANIVDPTSGTFTTISSGGPSCFHTMLIGNDEWCSGIPGEPQQYVSPYAGPGVPLPLSGTDTAVDTIIKTPSGDFYTSSSSFGFGTFGSINLSTGATVRLQGPMAGPHGGLYDPFSGDIILCGDGSLVQIDPANPTAIVSTFTSSPQFDQCSADGNGHLFVANNNDNILFMDYSTTKKVGSADFTDIRFLAASLDDIAPLSGAGSKPTPTPVGGTIIPVDMTSLFVAGITASAFWMVPTLGGIVGTIVAILRVRRSQN